MTPNKFWQCELFSKSIIKLFLLLLIICQQCNVYVNGFNLDVGNYIRHEGQRDSMFGFSVALHQEAGRSWVIIGAPTADTSALQQGVVKGGAVYRCDIADDNRCQIVPFDTNGNNYNEKKQRIDTKSNQWFGATVASSGIDGTLVACAPRYVYHTMQPTKAERIEPIGTCFIGKNNFQKFTEYSPCRTVFWGYHRQGSCQAGLSAALTKDGERLFIGAPGSWYWQGQEYSINTNAVYPYRPPRYNKFGEGGQSYSFNLNDPREQVRSTPESTAAEDDSYLGYSSVAGDFNGDGIQGVAVGMPRGAGLLGKVLLYSWNMTNQQNITGEQIGAYFGYSMCVVDVDGDKLDDLIIGAPMYTEPNNEGKYDTGRIYIMYQDKFNKFQTLDTRDGINSRGRFGLALTTLGDLNLDGYGDFAVGAPYDGPNNKGAVYIYYGSANGPLEKHSQVIYAEDVTGTQGLSTFGFSISGGIDLDGNMYPDLVVGAYEASKAIVFKSRPVAVMEASALFESESKLISLDERNCQVGRDKKEVTCTSVKSCLTYNGINLPPTIDIIISWVLDSQKPRSPRMFFVNDETKNIRNSTMRLYRGKTECRTERVYVKDNIRDKLTPLEVEMRYNLRSNEPAMPALTRRRRSTLEPVLDQNKGTVQKDSINIQKNCGVDNICIPDLRLDIKTVDKYLLGSKELLIIDVNIANHGEDAFEAGFYMNVPPGLNFRKIERIGDSRDTPITCTAPSPATNNTLKCDIGNPFSSKKFAKFKVLLATAQKKGMAPSYDFQMEVNSTNPEEEGFGYDNVIKKSIGIWIETDLTIQGKPYPEEITYNASQYKAIEQAVTESEIGPQVVHVYNIHNNGPSTIEEAEIFILFPYETRAGEPLMYLLNQPEISGNIKCDPSIYVNERELQLSTILENKKYLEQYAGVAESTVYSSQTGHRTSYTSSSSSGSSGSHVHVSTSSSSGGSRTSSSSSSGSATVLTEEERRKLDAEENLESTGDASFVHRHRAGQASGHAGGSTSSSSSSSSGSSSGGAVVVGGGHVISDGGSSHTSSTGGVSSGGHYTGNYEGQPHTEYSYSWNSSSTGDGPVRTYSSSYNKSTIRGADGRVHVSESSTEHYGTQNGNALIAGIGGSGATRMHEESSSSSSSSGGRQGNRVTGGGYRQELSTATSGAAGGVSGTYGTAASREGYNARQQSSQQYSRPQSTRTEYSSGGKIMLDDLPTEEIIHQDISDLNPRTHSTGSYTSGSSGTLSATGGSLAGQGRGSETSVATGRRRMMSQQDGQPPRADLITGAGTLEKAAQGGRGFQTSTFDLGVLSGRDNVDDEVRNRGSSSHIAASGGSGGRNGSYSSSTLWRTSGGNVDGQNFSERAGGAVGQSSGSSSSYSSQTRSGGGGGGGGGGYSSSSSYHSSSTGGNAGRGAGAVETSVNVHGGAASSSVASTNANEEDDYTYEDEYVEEAAEDTPPKPVQQHTDANVDYRQGGYFSHSRSHPSANRGLEPVDQRLKHYQRFRRETIDMNDLALDKALHCNATRCGIIRCIAGPLSFNEETYIALRTRLVAKTLEKISGQIGLNTSTKAIARVTKLPYIGRPKEMPLKSYEAPLTVNPEPTPKNDIVPLWVVVLSACAGTIILLLLIFLLYKCGFFNRNRPSDSSERQPLNRNGNYHGDEHL